MTYKLMTQAHLPVEVELTKKQIAWAIMGTVMDMTGHPDDAGCDWYTLYGKTYIAADLYGKGWKVSDDPNVAILVDAANVLHYGKKLTAINRVHEEVQDDNSCSCLIDR